MAAYRSRKLPLFSNLAEAPRRKVFWRLRFEQDVLKSAQLFKRCLPRTHLASIEIETPFGRYSRKPDIWRGPQRQESLEYPCLDIIRI